jgi:hypothetical protein
MVFSGGFQVAEEAQMAEDEFAAHERPTDIFCSQKASHSFIGHSYSLL